MSNSNPPGVSYWSLIEPVWLPLNRSWDQGASEFVRQFEATPLKVGHLYAAHWCQSEVCNGGLHQFFYNMTGLLAPEARRGFEAIGLDVWSVILAEAMNFFGSSYPRERFDRLKLLPVANGRARQEWDPFTALDEQFYDWLHAEHDRWEHEADRYAESA